MKKRKKARVTHTKRKKPMARKRSPVEDDLEPTHDPQEEHVANMKPGDEEERQSYAVTGPLNVGGEEYVEGDHIALTSEEYEALKAVGASVEGVEKKKPGEAQREHREQQEEAAKRREEEEKKRQELMESDDEEPEEEPEDEGPRMEKPLSKREAELERIKKEQSDPAGAGQPQAAPGQRQAVPKA